MYHFFDGSEAKVDSLLLLYRYLCIAYFKTKGFYHRLRAACSASLFVPSFILIYHSNKKYMYHTPCKKIPQLIYEPRSVNIVWFTAQMLIADYPFCLFSLSFFFFSTLSSTHPILLLRSPPLLALVCCTPISRTNITSHTP